MLLYLIGPIFLACFVFRTPARPLDALGPLYLHKKGLDARPERLHHMVDTFMAANTSTDWGQVNATLLADCYLFFLIVGFGASFPIARPGGRRGDGPRLRKHGAGGGCRRGGDRTPAIGGLAAGGAIGGPVGATAGTAAGGGVGKAGSAPRPRAGRRKGTNMNQREPLQRFKVFYGSSVLALRVSAFTNLVLVAAVASLVYNLHGTRAQMAAWKPLVIRVDQAGQKPSPWI